MNREEREMDRDEPMIIYQCPECGSVWVQYPKWMENKTDRAVFRRVFHRPPKTGAYTATGIPLGGIPLRGCK